MTSGVPHLLQTGQADLYGDHEHRKEVDVAIAELREANVRNFSEVLAVILESTGDVSVLHSNDGIEFDRDRLLKGVAQE